MSSDKAWVTLATNDSYSLGALVLAHSLKTVKTAYKLAVLITPGVTAPMKQQIEAVFDDVKTVDVLDSKDQAHLALMRRPELGVTFTKLHCWTFTDYEKCVFLDADTLVLQNCDELFEREELSAAPDPGWPDCFNSGVFVYKPSQDTFNELLEFARTRGSFDGGDQGLLNMFFKDWALKDISKHLSFTYNVVWSSTYSYLPALKQFGQNMKIVHFIASSKPWLQSFNTETRLVTATSGGAGLQTLLQLWWDLFCHHVHPRLSTEMIESRLSSRYSEVPSNNNNPNIRTPNNTPCNNNSNDYYTPSYVPPNEDYYNFVDPWDEYLVVSDQKKYEIEETPICESRIDNANCGDVMVEVCLGDLCEKEAENNYHINNCEETTNCSFQNNPIESSNIFDNEEKYTKRLEELSESIEQEQEQGNGNYPACSDDTPINPNSSLSVNNSRPDSPTHCEVPMDLQTYVLDGGLAGQFARISLNEKTADQKALEDFIRRQSWEQGNVDYLGKDSFSNIWAKINETLGNTAEVQVEVDVVKPVPPPEVVFTEDPKPLKSALKKTSTTTSPVQSELIDSSDEVPVKQLEKLDLSKDDSKRPGTPETPTVTSPTPPTTPASQAQPLSQTPDGIPNDDIPTKVSLGSAKPEEETTECDRAAEPVGEGTPGPEAVVPEEETTESERVEEEPVEKESPRPSEAAERKGEGLPGSDSTVPKPDGPAKEASHQPAEPARQPEPSVDSPTPLVANDPPVAPKRTNKGSSASAHKNVKPSENK